MTLISHGTPFFTLFVKRAMPICVEALHEILF